MTNKLVIGMLVCSVLLIDVARTAELQILTESSYLEMDLDFYRSRGAGGLRTGVGGAYRDVDDEDYCMLHGTVALMSASVLEGLRGFFGEVNRGPRDGSIGGIGFMLSLMYGLPQKFAPIPVDVFGGFVVSPELLSFSDLGNHQTFGGGVHFWLFGYAAISVAYRRWFEMDRGCKLSDGTIGAGLDLSF